MSASHVFRSIRFHLVQKGNSCPRERSCVVLSAPPLAQNMPATGNGSVILALTTATPLDSSSASQTKRTSMPGFFQVWNE